jgi:hypothetical protein
MPTTGSIPILSPTIAPFLETDAVEVVRQLRVFLRDINQMVDALGGKETVELEEKLWLQDLLRALKDRLKEAGKSRSENPLASTFLIPAVRGVASKLRMPVNSHPIQSDWFSAVYSARADLIVDLGRLERRFPTI